jgi:hypothetical protein
MPWRTVGAKQGEWTEGSACKSRRPPQQAASAERRRTWGGWLRGGQRHGVQPHAALAPRLVQLLAHGFKHAGRALGARLRPRGPHVHKQQLRLAGRAGFCVRHGLQAGAQVPLVLLVVGAGHQQREHKGGAEPGGGGVAELAQARKLGVAARIQEPAGQPSDRFMRRPRPGGYVGGAATAEAGAAGRPLGPLWTLGKAAGARPRGHPSSCCQHCCHTAHT